MHDVLNDYTENEIFEHDLSVPYEPMQHIGLVGDLKSKINNQKDFYPKTTLLLYNLLEANHHLVLLEDWFIILPYRLMWIDNKSEKNRQDLEWFEDLFKKIDDINSEAWKVWLDEIVQKCPDTNYLYNRFYEYLLHLYAAISLSNAGFNSIVFPVRKKGIVDIEAMRDGNSYAIECTLIKTSAKFASFCERWHNTRTFLGKKMPFTVNRLFSFPPSTSINSLNKQDLQAIKVFFEKIEENPESAHKGYYKSVHNKGKKEYSFELIYTPTFPALCVTIPNQREFSDELGVNFFNKSLTSTINKKINQLNQDKYILYKKIVFIGVQWDFEFRAPWTKESAEEIKNYTMDYFHQKGIIVMFSEDYGFSFEGYL